MSRNTHRPLRVLFTSTPGAGHIEPLAPLARALQEAGHVVLWATAEASCGRVRAMGFDVTAAGMGLPERAAAMAPRMPEVMALEPRERRQLLFSGFFAEIAAPRMHADLEPVLRSFRPDVMVHEMAELAAAPAAAGRGVPLVTVAFSGALSDDVMSGARARMQGIWASVGLADADHGAMLGALYLHPFPPSFGPPPAHPSVRLVRPGSAPGGRAGEGAERVDWLAELGTERPLVYLTAGTEMAAAAPWPAALEALAAMDVDAVATIGPQLDPATLGPLPPNVRVERFVPQHLLLERASVVASHGGAGTVLGAALHGVPQLVFPIAADQWENADAVARTGAGILCEPAERDSAHLASALRRLLHEPAVQSAAQVVASEVQAMPPAAAHVAAVEALVT